MSAPQARPARWQRGRTAALLVLLGLLGLQSQGAPAEACRPSPLGQRELFLRGSMNNWSASDEQRFDYVCNRYELYLRLSGEHSFKIGDEDWSADADFGGPPEQLQPKGPAISRRFTPGGHKLVLHIQDNSAQLQIQPFEGALPQRAVASDGIKDPVARSVRFDSRDAAHKTPFGAVSEGSEISFALSASPGIAKATLVIEQRRLEGNQELLDYLSVARVPMRKTRGGWQARHRFDAKAIYGYYFELEIGGRSYVYQNNKDTIYWTREKGSMGLGLIAEKPASAKKIRRFRQTVHAADFKVPAWARDIVYYYIFPERFRNGDPSNDPRPGRDRYQRHSVETHARWLDTPYKPGAGDGSDAVYNNDFFGGDLQGIIDKLDYIRELGANTIYMTPVFRAASNHKYDTADYRQIDPAFGTNADFERLTAEAARRGIRVIPDTSLNHVGSDSPYFNRFGNYPAGGAFDGGRLNPASPYASWFKLDPSQADPDAQYQGWVGVKDLPEIDKHSPAFRDFAYRAPDAVMKLWLDRGAAGWRMDVAPWVPDDFWREWRRAIKAHRPDALTVAETWFDASKYFLGDMFDSTMNYVFRNTVLDYAAGGRADQLYANLELLREAYPEQALFALMNLLSSHDQARALHHFGYHDDGDADAYAAARQRFKLALFFQMVYPGAPTIYYGDEVGLGGGDDPYNRRPYPWADQGGKPDQALLDEVRQLTRMRHAHPVLRQGSLGAPLHLDAHCIVLARRLGDQWAITAMNNSTQPRTLSIRLPQGLDAGARFSDALSGATLQAEQGQLLLELPPLFGRVLIRSGR